MKNVILFILLTVSLNVFSQGVINHCAIDKNIGFILLPVAIGGIPAASYFYKEEN
jgi:hypothetical protein